MGQGYCRHLESVDFGKPEETVERLWDSLRVDGMDLEHDQRVQRESQSLRYDSMEEVYYVPELGRCWGMGVHWIPIEEMILLELK